MRKLRSALRGTLAIFSIAFSAGAQSGATSHATPAGFGSEFLGQFNTSMSKFIALAEAMPADKYAWSPGPGVMSVAKVYAHVAHYNYRYPSQNMAVALPTGVRLDTLEAVAAKAQVLALLRQSAEYVRGAVNQMPESRLAGQTRLYGRDVQRWAVLFQLLAHMNEHLGQSIAYARMNGVVPPWSG
ncbi:MAG: DinB family protein [Gemmatimonadaceae bacterium]